MAERRMFAKTIIDSDAFLDMPLSTQALYFHLSMRADDDGFVNSAKKIQRTIGGNDDDFKILLSKKFIIPFETGVCVIKHWKIHNLIQKDRYKPTLYESEKSKLTLKNNNSYTLDTECIQDVSKLESQVSIGEVSEVKSSQVEVSQVENLADKSATTKKGKAIDRNWVLPKSWGDWALAERTDLDAGQVRKIAEEFKDYWLSIANQAKAKRADWEATWRNWIRKQKVSSQPKTKFQQIQENNRKAGEEFLKDFKNTEKDVSHD